MNWWDTKHRPCMAPVPCSGGSSALGSGFLVFRADAHRLAVPLGGGQAADEEVAQVVFGDSLALRRILRHRVLLGEGAVVWQGGERHPGLVCETASEDLIFKIILLCLN